MDNSIELHEVKDLPIDEIGENKIPKHSKKKRRKPKPLRNSNNIFKKKRKAPERPSRVKNSSYPTNYGSEPSSEESDDDDEELAPVFIPRAFFAILDFEGEIESVNDQENNPISTYSTRKSAINVPFQKTLKPWTLHDFNWTPIPQSHSPKPRRESFENDIGPTISAVDPYEIFVSIWDRQIMQHIAFETNKYAQRKTAEIIESLTPDEMIENNSVKPEVRLERWSDTNVNELYVYFAITLAMEVVQQTRLDLYWSSEADIFSTPGYGAHMRYDRYMLLSKHIHFNDNEEMNSLNMSLSDAKIFKIKPLLNHLNFKFQSLYNPSQNLAINESVITSKSSITMGQINENGRAIKCYELCEPCTGYLWRIEISSNKTDDQPNQHTLNPLETNPSSTVLKLAQGLENKGHTLWMNQDFNSPSLARRLKSIGIDCAGTMKVNRKYVPEDLKNIFKASQLKTGEVCGVTSNDLDVLLWNNGNSNIIPMISTYHGDTVTHNRGSIKPILISDYMTIMNSMDKKDILLSNYSTTRGHAKIFYKNLFRKLLNKSVLNSFVIHSFCSKISHRNFRTNLIDSLLAKHSRMNAVNGTYSNKLENVNICVAHRLSYYPFNTHQRLRRACQVCKKKVNTYCVGCAKTVCLGECFVALHEPKNIGT